MLSMTSYAYTEVNTDSYSLSVEIKTVNSRFMDLSISLPSFLGRLEAKIKESVSAKLQRGKVDIFIRLKEKNIPLNISVDEEAAKSYFSAFSKIAKAIGKKEKDIPLSLIVNQEGVISTQKEIDIDSYWKIIQPAINESLDKILIERKREGENLQKDILSQVTKIENALQVFLEWQPKMEAMFRENIVKRFEEVLGDKVDEQRVMTETAALLIKYTINEEIVRLKSHVESLKNEIENNPTPGKKIDFICQEMNREVNTIGSKNQILEVGKAVILAKDAVENIREQSKNIE